jgi:hypothetical protein
VLLTRCFTALMGPGLYFTTVLYSCALGARAPAVLAHIYIYIYIYIPAVGVR